MEPTRFIVRVGVSFDASGYEEAGEILDQIDRTVGKVLRGRGHHEITGFETRPCKAALFDQRAAEANIGVELEPENLRKSPRG